MDFVQEKFLIGFCYNSFLADEDEANWSSWSSWSACSRTCDGGITQQFRRCKSIHGCHGISIRRKMCNMQVCTELKDYRTEQCRAFNGILYKGKGRRWEGLEDHDNPCALICRAEGTDIIAKLSPKVRDGTRCDSGALHVCVDGRCEPVGCDLRLGSRHQVDECGICGGDGTTCTTPVFRWEILANGPCSSTCGGGQQPVKVVCKNSFSAEVADSNLCNSAQKPYRLYQSCNIQPCDPEWIITDWSDCSVSCGGGLKIRKVYCAQEKNSSKIQIAEKHCPLLTKPINQEPCNLDSCPHWHIGPWSLCSTDCGIGYQTRNVICRDAHSAPNPHCDMIIKPKDNKPCPDNPPCPTISTSTTTTTSTTPPPKITKINLPPPTIQTTAKTTINSYALTNDIEDIDEIDQQNNNYNHYVSTDAIDLNLENNNHLEDLDSDIYLEAAEELPREHTLPLIQPYFDSPLANSYSVFDQNFIPSEPTFVAEPWGPCSSTCGEGIRTRDVNCKIYLEFSRTIANLPDKECPEPKPTHTESCFLQQCPEAQDEKSGGENFADAEHAALADGDSRLQTTNFRKSIAVGLPPGLSISDMTFSWKVLGYTPCSASCLGGIQEAMIHCVRDFDQRIATPVLCMDKPQPDIATTRTCNDHPCPPRWNVSDFGPCSKPCGGGVMTREVNCIHEVTRGNTVIVPNNICPQPAPRTERLCNTVNCPPYWEPGEWGKCDRDCGGGSRTRTLNCKQIIALGQVVEWPNPENHCTQSKPIETRECNKKSCDSTTTSSISKGEKDHYGQRGSSHQSTNYSPKSSPDQKQGSYFRQEEFKKKLTLSVKGHATIYNGVTLKLRCPGKASDRPRIVWMKDYHYVNLHNKRLALVPKSGVLKIKNTTFSDSGVYSCLYPLEGVRTRNRQEPNYHQNQDKKTRQRGKNHPESTLFADQQPVPMSGQESFITPNTKVFTAGSSSSSSSSRLEPHYIFNLFLLPTIWLFKPLSNIFNPMDNELPLRTESEKPNTNNWNQGLDFDFELTTSGFDTDIDTNVITDQDNVKKHKNPDNNNQSNNKRNEEDLYDSGRNCKSYEEDNGLLLQRIRRGRHRRHRHRRICAKNAKWKIGQWSECSSELCFTWNTSLQTRDIHCEFLNGSKTDDTDSNCQDLEKPQDSRECFNPECKGVWATESWSDCKAKCGSVGFKTRILKCVWFGSEDPAGSACKSLIRPIVKKSCRGPPCLKVEDCINRSRQCPAIRTFNLCHLRLYQYHCCESCFDHKYPIHKLRHLNFSTKR